MKKIFIVNINNVGDLSLNTLNKIENAEIIYVEKNNKKIIFPFKKSIEYIDINNYEELINKFSNKENICLIFDTLNKNDLLDSLIENKNIEINIDDNITNILYNDLDSYKVINANNPSLDIPDYGSINIFININDKKDLNRVKEHLIKYFSKKIEIYVIRKEKLDKIRLKDLNDGDEALFPITLIIKKQDFLLIKGSLNSFMDLIAYLRSDKGCPWDRKQTHESLKKHLLEETYEVIDAIDRNNIEDLKEELGDLLLQIALHCQIEIENSSFDERDVIDSISSKIIRRHPYVFDNTILEGEDTSKVWNEVKKEEKSYTNFSQTMESVPKVFPALLYANKIQSRAKNANFDFEDYNQALDKIHEEINEFENEINNDEDNLFMEAGDLLFSVVNTLRLLDINSEEALKASTNKFILRFSMMEKLIEVDNNDITGLKAEILEKYWEKAKLLLK
ncbi:nucleoside triphosphate pyrophosphohydrolase [Anaerofustis stercorihominis]|uniref:nucleoside triphosphate pyrophosphohydrolase n=1 Tax=Anaerofustis stercorihominis TaxID=214853 RepID=UPI00214B2169|nr:nucleoside triphosphate pyrophosphohydrolase [Anaerofustis stercorihominis]MCR2033486.1 nucleoside triphosphate pyrophosphohydrolase [Anaerofustis stercorihominis]